MFFIPARRREGGQFVQPNLPFSTTMGAAWKQGVEETLYNTLREDKEDVYAVQGSSPLLTADEANSRYSMDGLEFNEPITDAQAALLNKRKRRELARMRTLELGVDGLLTVRGIASLATSIIANNANPIDFSFNFVPVTSGTRFGKALAPIAKNSGLNNPARHMAAARAARAMAASAKSADDMAKVSLKAAAIYSAKNPGWAYRAMAASVDAAVGNLILEVPLFYRNRANQTPHTLQDSILNVGLGGAFGGGLSAIGSALKYAGRKWRAATHTTRERIVHHAVFAELEGREYEIDSQLDADPRVLQHRVEFNYKAQMFNAIKDADAKITDIEAAFAAHYFGLGEAGGVRMSEFKELAGQMVAAMEGSGHKDAKKARALLKKTKAGDGAAAKELEGVLGLRIDHESIEIPADLFLSANEGRVMKDFSELGEMPNLEKVRKIADKIDRRRLAEIRKKIADDVQVERNRLVHESFRKAARKHKSEAKGLVTKQDYEAIKRRNDETTPPPKSESIDARTAEYEADIDNMIARAGSEASESLKAKPKKINREAVVQTLNCIVSNAL